MLHTGKSADYVNLALKNGAVSLVINLGSGAFEALVEPVNGKFNDNAWHDVKVTRNLRQVTRQQEVEEWATEQTGEERRLKNISNGVDKPWKKKRCKQMESAWILVSDEMIKFDHLD